MYGCKIKVKQPLYNMKYDENMNKSERQHTLLGLRPYFSIKSLSHCFTRSLLFMYLVLKMGSSKIFMLLRNKTIYKHGILKSNTC